MKHYKNIEGNSFYKFELYYDKWGVSYFTGSTARRGIYLSVRKVERSECNWYVSESFSMLWWEWDGKILIKEMNRFSQKTMWIYEDIFLENIWWIEDIYTGPRDWLRIKSLFPTD